MSVVIRRSCLKVLNIVLPSFNRPSQSGPITMGRSYSDEKRNNLDFSNTTILIENGFNVYELPVIVRKLKNISEIDDNHTTESSTGSRDSHNLNLIQTEFNECIDLRDVFTLLSKCTKITPNIALVAIERISDLEKNSVASESDSKSIHVNLAKGAVLDKLLKVVMSTEESQTILNILNAVSTFIEPHKHQFCDELLFRVIDNKLSVEQLCDFATFLIRNKADPKYAKYIDKLWVGFLEKSKDINERNIIQLFSLVPDLKSSKKTVMNLLEQRLCDLWYKINVLGMQVILDTFLCERCLSLNSYAAVGQWLNTNIHALDEDTLLDVITKLTRLNYTDTQIENAIKKYMKMKGTKIQSNILIVGILNYCMHFKIRNESILNTCCDYFLKNHNSIQNSFLSSFIHPYGFLSFYPTKSKEFWEFIEEVVNNRFDRLKTNDICSIILSSIYAENYPLKLSNKIFNLEYVAKVKNAEVMKKLYLIDTALSLECEGYLGPLLPKNSCNNLISLDSRIKNMINKIKESLIKVAGGPDKLSVAVLIPHLCSDETYLIDIMLHPTGLGSNTFNWKSKIRKNENTAILIHLPDHYCSDDKQLIGPQVMKKRHLRRLGMRVASIKYSTLSQLYTTHKNSELIKYLKSQIEKAEKCI